MDEIERRYAKLIADQFPDVGIHTVESLGEGFRNYAILVNGEWVFRFPKSRRGAEELDKEIRLLPLLADRVQVAIPQLTYVGKQDDGYSFVGYRKVCGELVGEDGVPAMNASGRGRLADQLAEFLNALHAFPVEEALRAGVPVRRLASEFERLRRDAERQAYPLLGAASRDYLIARFRAYLDHAAYTGYAPALIHADLSPDHYLMDAGQTELTGIIDFGDAAISDPDYDYTYLLEDCGEAFTRQVMNARGQADSDERLRKVALFVTFDQVRYLLDGVEANDPDWIEEGLAAVEEDRRLRE